MWRGGGAVVVEGEGAAGGGMWQGGRVGERSGDRLGDRVDEQEGGRADKSQYEDWSAPSDYFSGSAPQPGKARQDM